MGGTNDVARKVWDWEIIMARNQLYKEMLQIQDNTTDTFNQIAQQLVYVDRRITNQELAERVSKVDADSIRRVADEYFLDNEIAVV